MGEREELARGLTRMALGYAVSAERHRKEGELDASEQAMSSAEVLNRAATFLVRKPRRVSCAECGLSLYIEPTP